MSKSAVQMPQTWVWPSNKHCCASETLEFRNLFKLIFRRIPQHQNFEKLDVENTVTSGNLQGSQRPMLSIRVFLRLQRGAGMFSEVHEIAGPGWDIGSSANSWIKSWEGITGPLWSYQCRFKPRFVQIPRLKDFDNLVAHHGWKRGWGKTWMYQHRFVLRTSECSTHCCKTIREWKCEEERKLHDRLRLSIVTSGIWSKQQPKLPEKGPTQLLLRSQLLHVTWITSKS